MKNFFKFSVISMLISIVFGLGFLQTGYAATQAQISIVPTSTAAISVNSSSAVSVTYGVTANAPIDDIQVSPSSPEYPLPSYITATLSADTCTNATLVSSGTCAFTVSLISATGHTGSSFTLAPVISGNSGASRSIPTAGNRISATVSAAPSTYTVTPSGTNVTIDPNTAQTVNNGATQAFSVTASSGYTRSDTVGGTCAAGSWSGSTYTTGAVTSDCTVSFSATLNTYTVTPSAGSNGSISPTGVQTVNSGESSPTFTATPDSGYGVSGWTVDGSAYSACSTNTTCQLTNITANHTIEVDFVASTITISANTTNSLFSFNDANATGTMGTGSSVITITNNSSTTAATNVAGVTPLPTGVTESANNCGASLAASATCLITFQTAATPDSTQTISIKGDNTNTLSLPIAPLSIRVYSPPVNPVPTNASLMVVKTCTIPEQLLLTNNSDSSVSTISITKDSGLSDASVTSAMDNCPTTLPTGKTCILAITAPSSSGSTNTQGNIIVNWGSSSTGAVFTGIEATGATLPTLSTPTSAVTVFGGYVYQEDATCNLVKVAALADQYTPPGSVAWTTSDYTSTAVPNPATGAGTGAQNTGLAAGQINTTAVIYQAGTPLTSYAAGLCSQYSETSSGTNYVGWYLPWDNRDASGSTTTELAAMYTNLKSGQASGNNGFVNDFYWSSSETDDSGARDRIFGSGSPFSTNKNTWADYVRCSRALTY